MINSNHYSTLFLGASLVLFLLGGCSGAPTKGELAQDLSVEARAIADNWAEGEAMVAKGEKLIAKGRDQMDDGEKLVRKGKDRIEEGEDNVERGNRLVAQGRKQVSAAATEFSLKYPDQYREIMRRQ